MSTATTTEYPTPSYEGLSWDKAAQESTDFIARHKITSAAHVLAVLNADPHTAGISYGPFFHSGSSTSLLDGLQRAGWEVTWMEAHYYYVAESPTGDFLTYCEGDVSEGHGGKVCRACYPGQSTVAPDPDAWDDPTLCSWHDWHGADAVKPARS